MLSIKRRLAEARESDGGFTLIELAVVILIIGILLAIAIPTFLGIRKNAQNKAAQHAARNVFVLAKAQASDNGSYNGLLQTELQSGAPEVTIAEGATAVAADSKHVVFQVTSDTVIIASRSQSGDCYLIRDNLDDNGTVAKLPFAKIAGTTKAAGCIPDSAATWLAKW